MALKTESPAKIEIQNLNLWFGTKQILNAISTDIQERKLTALIGPSGCGKTSLLRCLNRMHDFEPTARVEGRTVLHALESLEDEKKSSVIDILDSKTDPLWVRMCIGMVFQKANPFPKSVFENVVYGLRVRGERKRKVLEERCEEALTQAALFTEVKDRLNANAYSLSGGQQQRLCLARALAVRPEVLLLDEPTSALDPLSTEKIEALFSQLKSSITLVMVTHNLQQAKRIADDVGMMWMGELIEKTSATEIFQKPQNEKTIAYVTGRLG